MIGSKYPKLVGRQDVWGADEVERIVKRNAMWLGEFLIAGIKAVMKDGRPLFTEKIPEKDRLAALLQAPPAFWDAMQTQNPEMAADLVAKVIKARLAGKIPPQGPLADQVTTADGQQAEAPSGEVAQVPTGLFTPVPDIGKPGTGTERPVSVPKFAKQAGDMTG